MFVVELVLRAPGDQAVLLRLGALPGQGIVDGQYWRLLTHAGLHAGWWHIALNTALLLIAGPPAERWLGSWRCLGVALLGAVLGGVATLLVQHGAGTLSVGASGAFFALLGAACVAGQVSAQSTGMRRRLWITLTVGLLYSCMPGVGMAAHLAGLVVGSATVLSSRMHRAPKETYP